MTRRLVGLCVFVLLAPLRASAQRGLPWPAVAAAERCTKASSSNATPTALVEHAVDLMGMSTARDHLLHLKVVDDAEQNYQSDRPYPPFLSLLAPREIWFDPTTGAEREATGFAGALQPTNGQPRTTITDATSTYFVSDSLIPLPQQRLSALESRPLDVWAMLSDWRGAHDVRVAGECVYRDYSRIVLSRRGPIGEERLYLDPKTGFPVKLERTEAHYLWGQIRAEYVYSTWQEIAGLRVPGVSFRLMDGTREVERVFESLDLVRRDSAPSTTLPSSRSLMAAAAPLFLQPIAPDTVRVGAHAFLLKNRGYAELAVLARDTVFMLEATQGEKRAQQDSAWIGRLFPGRHPIVVVVTDLAWPHIAGVRYWAAQRAPIISHVASREFLTQVILRPWANEPDLLERVRARTPSLRAVPFRFIGVSDSLVRAGGDVRIYPIDGIASEGALMVYLPGERFLWASDYIQSAKSPTEYATEVWQAVQRYHLSPTRVAAQHLPITDWNIIDHLARPADPATATEGSR